MPLTSISVAIPRQVFVQMNGFPEGIRLGEDFLLWIHVALQYKVAFLNKPLAFYNQDVETANRGTGRLHEPCEHMLWNLTDLESEEQCNNDYKALVDALRVSALMPYYLSKKHRQATVSELNKVDWSRQPEKIRREYKRPIGFLKLKHSLMKTGSDIKRILISFTNGTSNSN